MQPMDWVIYMFPQLSLSVHSALFSSFFYPFSTIHSVVLFFFVKFMFLDDIFNVLRSFLLFLSAGWIALDRELKEQMTIDGERFSIEIIKLLFKFIFLCFCQFFSSTHSLVLLFRQIKCFILVLNYRFRSSNNF